MRSIELRERENYEKNKKKKTGKFILLLNSTTNAIKYDNSMGNEQLDIIAIAFFLQLDKILYIFPVLCKMFFFLRIGGFFLWI